MVACGQISLPESKTQTEACHFENLCQAACFRYITERPKVALVLVPFNGQNHCSSRLAAQVQSIGAIELRCVLIVAKTMLTTEFCQFILPHRVECHDHNNDA